MSNETINKKDQLCKLAPEDVLNEQDAKKKALKLQYFTQQCRLEVFDMIRKRGNGHWGGSSSAAEILTALYFHIMQIDPANPSWEDRDRLVLSKGHAAPMLYNLLANRGYFSVKELDQFRCLNSMLQGHPSMNLTPGVEMSTGALGHGLSVGLGMALAARYRKKQFRTFVLTGEGCLNEGETWEALMAAAKLKPSRLVIMIDYNKVQLDGSNEEILPLDPLPEKFKAFNLRVADRIYDGHDISDILASWEWIKQNDSQPVVVIYKTHKGKGVSFMEDNHKWHGAPIDDVSYKNGRPELIEGLNNIRL